MLRTRDLSCGQVTNETNYIKTNRNQTKTIMGSCQAPFSESALVGTGGV